MPLHNRPFAHRRLQATLLQWHRRDARLSSTVGMGMLLHWQSGRRHLGWHFVRDYDQAKITFQLDEVRGLSVINNTLHIELGPAVAPPTPSTLTPNEKARLNRTLYVQLGRNVRIHWSIDENAYSFFGQLGERRRALKRLSWFVYAANESVSFTLDRIERLESDNGFLNVYLKPSQS